MGWPIRKNDAAGATLVFPIYDNDGDLVTAAVALDSEISKDEGTFTDVTAEAAETATASGMYSLALSQAEINADRIATITKTSTSDAKTAVNVVYTSTRNIDDLAYPATSGRSMVVESDGVVHSDMKEWLGVAPLALVSQRPQVEVDAYDGSVDFNATQKASIQTEADASLTSYDALVPADLPANFASMGIEADGHVHGDIKEWLGSAPNALQTGRVDSYVGAMAAAVIAAANFVAGAIDTSAIAAGAITASEAPNLDAAISTRATPAQVNTEVSDVLKTDTISELSQGQPSATPTFEDALMLLYMAFRNRMDIDTTATDYKEIYNDAGTVIAKKTLTDDGTIYSEAKMASGP